MSEYINFNELKFNLYELLAVSNDASTKKIKSAYRKLIVKVHPDKGNYEDDEVFNHLTIANQILTDFKLRESYDNWLDTSNLSHLDLKNNFENIEKIPISKEEAYKSYDTKIKELNKKHGYVDSEEKNITDLYNKKLEEFNKNIYIESQDIKNNDEFNSKFENIPIDNIYEKHNNSIIEFNGELVGNTFLSIGNYSMLYSSDPIQTSNYSSLDRAFKIQPKINFVENNDIDNKIKEYENLTDELSYKFSKNNISIK